MKSFLIALIVCCSSASAQVFSNRLSADQRRVWRATFNPIEPNQGQWVRLTYQVDSAIFQTNQKVYGRVFFTGQNSSTGRKEFPRVLELSLKRDGGLLGATFQVPADATGMVAVFLDSLATDIDNNEGQGYWNPFFKGSTLLPGSLSGIANLLAGEWPPQYFLKERKDVARTLYEMDFELHPEVKRKFTQSYLSTFDIHDTRDRALFKRELDAFAHYPDLGEWELFLGVKRHYERLGELDSAKKYEHLVYERFPHGSRALQVNSLQPAIEIEKAKDIETKWMLYQKFKSTYCKDYPDEFTQMLMNNRKGQILRGMFLGSFQSNMLAAWEAEVNALDEGSIYSTYYRTAAMLVDMQRSSILKEKENDASVLETFQLNLKSTRDELLGSMAEQFAWKASLGYHKNIDGPRSVIDQPSSTDSEVRSLREERYAEVLDVLGQTLLLQNRMDEAQRILKEAVELSHRRVPSINEHYIESLVKSGRMEEAIRESEIVIKLGKSTGPVSSFYGRYGEGSSPALQANTDLRSRLKKLMIDRDLPEGRLLNQRGEELSLRDFYGKTIVIDFWATWCVPCIVGMRAAADVIARYKDEKDIVFLFVNTERITDETKRRVAKRLEEMDGVLESFYDPDYNTTKAFEVEALPSTFIIDRKGRIRFQKVGILVKKDKQELRDELIAMIEMVR